MEILPKDNFHSTIKEAALKEGGMATVRIRDNPIILAKIGGQIYGVTNRCPHMGCSFDNGILTGYVLMCPCHGWKFDVRTGQYQVIDTVKLDCYRIEVRNGKIFVEIPKK